MFTVSGWSVPVDKLKAQQQIDAKGNKDAVSASNEPTKEERSSTKRKRVHGKINGTIVTTDNVAELWQKHIEGRNLSQGEAHGAKLEKSRKKRRQKQQGDDARNPGQKWDLQYKQEATSSREPAGTEHSDRSGSTKGSTKAPTDPPPPSSDGKSKYQQRKAKAQQKAILRKSHPPSPLPQKVPSKPLKPAHDRAAPSLQSLNTIPMFRPSSPLSKLTPLQTAMRAKLISARFRHINQTLYTTPSMHASSLFTSNPEAFASYHAGFRAQVASWPQDPVELFVQDIKTRGAVAGPKSQQQLFKEQKKKKKKGGKVNNERPVTEANADGGVKLNPLPRSATTKACKIVDLGCGDARLHAYLTPYAPSLNISLQSFDLSSGDTANA
ncbi:MAG: hypothetical protein L6R39_005164, partial [Caloplaca ligustica]